MDDSVGHMTRLTRPNQHLGLNGPDPELGSEAPK